MIRRYLLSLYLLPLFLLSSIAHADTYSASLLWRTSYVSGAASAESACSSSLSGASASYTDAWRLTGYTGVTQQSTLVFTCNGTLTRTSDGVTSPQNYATAIGEYVCPNGGTLSDTMCTKSCTPPQVLQPDGSCSAPNPCPAKSGGYGWMAAPVSGSSLESQTYCDNGCMVGLNAPSGANNPGFSYTNGQQRLQKYEIVYPGAQCSSGAPLPSSTEPSKTPPEPPKRPNCSPNEGVLTSSTGQVHCVPEGTPASKPPIVTKEQQTKTNGDGTTTTTETTTTRDSQTGAEEKKSTSTTKDGNGNVLSVTSDTTSKGTTTGSNPDKPGDSDFCQKNPTLDICTGKLNKEETQKKIADDIKSLTNPGDTSTDPLKNATHTTESENQLKAENDKFTDAAKGITDPTAASKSSWQQAMESGWFSAIPSAGCTPITGTVGGRQFTIDHCEKASQISDIMSYALWFMLVVGSFVMFTGGQVRT